MKLNIIKNSKYFYLFSGTLLLISLLSLIAWGLKPGIDFTGGSFLELNFMAGRPATGDIQKALTGLDLGELKIQESGEKNIILRFKHIDEETHQKIISQIRDNFKNERDPAQVVQEERFESVGPIIGKELRDRSWLAIFLASIMIIGYIAYAFRKVSKPVASWKFGVIAVVALIHDILIVTGTFSLLGHLAGVEVDSLFITALLTILGFSVHDTIVVFDRTRENLKINHEYREKKPFDEIVGKSVTQTFTRSINTSLTTLIALLILYIFGSEATRYFSLALIVGILVGTYSSIFIASTLLVSVEKWQGKKQV